MPDDDDAAQAPDLERLLWREDTPEHYIDAFRITISPYTAYFQFSVADPASGRFKPMVVVRMSPEHAKVMAVILKRTLLNHETESGIEIPVNPQILKENEIDLGKEWRR